MGKVGSGVDAEIPVEQVEAQPPPGRQSVRAREADLQEVGKRGRDCFANFLRASPSPLPWLNFSIFLGHTRQAMPNRKRKIPISRPAIELPFMFPAPMSPRGNGLFLFCNALSEI